MQVKGYESSGAPSLGFFARLGQTRHPYRVNLAPGRLPLRLSAGGLY